MRVDKALIILKMLFDHPILTCKKIADSVGVSSRSVHRYIDELCVSGIPIEYKHGRYGGVYISADYKKNINLKSGGIVVGYGS